MQRKRPDDAESILKRFYEAVNSNSNSNNSNNKSKDPIIGFIDESSLCLSTNKVRVINTKHVRYSESNKNNNNGSRLMIC